MTRTQTPTERIRAALGGPTPYGFLAQALEIAGLQKSDLRNPTEEQAEVLVMAIQQLRQDGTLEAMTTEASAISRNDQHGDGAEFIRGRNEMGSRK